MDIPVEQSSVAVEPRGLPAFRGFACPQEGLDETFFDLVVSTHAEHTARLFLERHAMLLQQNGRGVAALLEDVLQAQVGWPASWDLSWGIIFQTLREIPMVSWQSSAASLALWLGACGVPGDWELQMEGSVRLRWGSWLLSAADRIAVRSSGSLVEISTTESGRSTAVQLTGVGGDWRADGAATRLPSFGPSGGEIALLPGVAVTREMVELLELQSAAILAEISPGVRGEFQAAVTFVQSYAPSYLPWILRVLRQIVPLETDARIQTSGSSRDAPGLSHMSTHANPRYLGEALVHEATHQYLHVLSWLGPTDDGSDSNPYYSPLKKTGRPLRAILAAFHAVANILLYYRLCLANGAPDDGYLARSEPLVADQAEQLARPLRGNSALTGAGEALFYPLLERIGG